MDFDVSGIKGIQLAKPCPGRLFLNWRTVMFGFQRTCRVADGVHTAAVGIFKITALLMCGNLLEEILCRKLVRKFVRT